MSVLAARLLKLAEDDGMLLIDDTHDKKAPAPKPAPAPAAPNWVSDLRLGFGDATAQRDPGVARSAPRPAPAVAPASAPAPKPAPAPKQPERFSPEAGDPGLNPRFNFWRGKVMPPPTSAPAPAPAPKPPAKTASFAARLHKLADDTGLPVPDLELGLKERLKKSLMEVEQARPLSQGEYRARKVAGFSAETIEELGEGMLKARQPLIQSALENGRRFAAPEAAAIKGLNSQYFKGHPSVPVGGLHDLVTADAEKNIGTLDRAARLVMRGDRLTPERTALLAARHKLLMQSAGAKLAEEIPHGHAALVGALAGGAASVLDPGLHAGASMAAGGGLGLLAAARHNKRQRDHAKMKEEIKREIVEALPKTAAMLTLDDLHRMQDNHAPGHSFTPEQLHEILAKKYKQAAMGMNTQPQPPAMTAGAPPVPAAGTAAPPPTADPATGPGSNNMASAENPYSSNMPAGAYGRPAASDATSSTLPANASAPKSQETKFNVGTFKPNAPAIS